MNLIRHVEDQCWEVLAQVSDPEIPVLSVLELGMIRGWRSTRRMKSSSD